MTDDDNRQEAVQNSTELLLPAESPLAGRVVSCRSRPER